MLGVIRLPVSLNCMLRKNMNIIKMNKYVYSVNKPKFLVSGKCAAEYNELKRI